MTDIAVAELTTCRVSRDGECIQLLFVDQEGQPGSLTLTIDGISALIMTLPALANAALRAQHGDSSRRIVYTLDKFRLEAARGCGSRILTLKTPDGFEVAFALAPETAEQLHAAIAVETPPAIALQ
jgi:hypothetical protein